MTSSPMPSASVGSVWSASDVSGEEDQRVRGSRQSAPLAGSQAQSTAAGFVVEQGAVMRQRDPGVGFAWLFAQNGLGFRPTPVSTPDRAGVGLGGSMAAAAASGAFLRHLRNSRGPLIADPTSAAAMAAVAASTAARTAVVERVGSTGSALSRDGSTRSAGSLFRLGSMGRAASVRAVPPGSAVAGTEADFLCAICYENLPREERFQVVACAEHETCRSCARAYVRTYIDNGGVASQMTCAGSGECLALFTRDDVLRLEGGDETSSLFRRFEDFLGREAGRSTECPGCHRRVEGDPAHPQTVCTHEGCGTRFCFHHGLAHPPEESCDSYLRRVAVVDVATHRLLTAQTVPCPRCGVAVSKTRGCNHMTCRCGCNFCWLCGDDIGGNIGGHYAAGAYGTGCPGMQFSSGGPNSRRRTPEERARIAARAACARRVFRVVRPFFLLISPILLLIYFVLFILAAAITSVLTILVLPTLCCESCEDRGLDCAVWPLVHIIEDGGAFFEAVFDCECDD